MLTLYNTLTRQREQFIPRNPTEIGFYACGPTVYHFTHIGNLRTYILGDILRRVLQMDGYPVKHVMNITDVGHLTDDGDAGEDKMEKGSRREGKTAWEVAAFYTTSFLADMDALNNLPPHILCKATDHIPEQIAQVQALIDKGFTYETTDGIYFDTTKLSDYGKLAQLDRQDLQAGARVDMGEKKNPHDFALWKFSPTTEQRQMEWNAFGRLGFPGWHIECSAMSMKYLGNQFDLHCGGIDLIPVHHTNEIAQAEGITGQIPWVSYWVHGEHIQLSGEKMSKSGGNFFTLKTITDSGLSPLAYRYFVLQAHYRKQLQFSVEAVQAAATGLKNLRKEIQKLSTNNGTNNEAVLAEFKAAVNDDLNTSQALAILWAATKAKTIDQNTVTTCDEVLGLDLLKIETANQIEIPAEIQTLLNARQTARTNKQWVESDRLRDEIHAAGYTIKDQDTEQIITKI